MKNKNITKVCVAIAIGLVVSVGALAAPLNGDINFEGAGTFNGTGPTDATQITFGTVTTKSGSTNDYSTVAAGTAVTFKTFTFGAAGTVGANAIDDLWSFTSGGESYTFDLIRLTVNSVGGAVRVIEGWGTAQSSKAGIDDQSAFFSLSTSGSETSITFSSVTEVPDSGTTTALLGLSLLGLAGAARRLRK